MKKNAARCVEKNDIEVSIIKPDLPDHQLDHTDKSEIATDNEPDDTIWINYDAISPFGAINFKIDDKDVSGNLFGFQARLVDFPYFMDELINKGKQALIGATTEKKNIRAHLLKAAKYRMIADIIAQTLWIKNNNKAKSFLKEKYSTGMDPDHIDQLVEATDITLRQITRRSRTVGMIAAFILFAIGLDIYFIDGGRESIKSMGLPELAVVPIDVLLWPLGIMVGVYSSKISAKWSQEKALKNIVPDNILNRTLPKAGKTIHWSATISAVLMIIFLILAIFSDVPLPSWLMLLVSQIHAAIPAS